MTKKKIQLVCVIIIICLLAGWYFAQDYMNTPAELTENAAKSSSSTRRAIGGPLNVVAFITEPVHLVDKIVVTGSILPDEQVDLTFETSGKIVEIHFTEGATVKKGELLAKVNDKPLQAQLLKLQSQRKLAEDRLFRQRALLDKDAVSKETYETVFTNLETINADIQLIEANISLTEMRAPFDGVVGLRWVSEGAYATPTTKVTNITKIEPLKLEFSVPELYSDRVKKGANVLFSIQGSLKEYQAKVYAHDSKLSENTKTLGLRAIYPNQNKDLMPGRYASVQVEFADIRNAISVPSEAIIQEMGKYILFQYKNGKAVQVEVIPGIRTPSQIQIVTGVAFGDTIITSGILQLRNGLPVKIDGFIKAND